MAEVDLLAEEIVAAVAEMAGTDPALWDEAVGWVGRSQALAATTEPEEEKNANA